MPSTGYSAVEWVFRRSIASLMGNIVGCVAWQPLWICAGNTRRTIPTGRRLGRHPRAGGFTGTVSASVFNNLSTSFPALKWRSLSRRGCREVGALGVCGPLVGGEDGLHRDPVEGATIRGAFGESDGWIHCLVASLEGGTEHLYQTFLA